MPKDKHSTANRPEKRFGPYAGGVGCAVWLNTIQTAHGPRKLRSITINPRRYRDAESGEWRDSSSFRLGDLPALLFALQQAQAFCISEPIPGETPEHEPGAEDVPY
jgi:hypothetical protein